MRLAFFVNDVATEIDEYTTTRLARPRPRVGMRFGTSGSETFRVRGKRWAARGPSPCRRVRQTIEDLQQRPCASSLGVVVGQMLKARGVTVVNDPRSLVRGTRSSPRRSDRDLS